MKLQGLKSWRWALLGLGVLLLRILFGLFPELTEVLYSTGIFAGIRSILDYTINLLPFPSMLLVIAFCLFLMVRHFRRRKRMKRSVKKRLLLFGKGLLNFMGGVLFFFMILWGFNYARTPLAAQAGLTDKPISITTLTQIAPQLNSLSAEARQRIPGITSDAITAEHLPEDLESTMRGYLEKTLTDLGYTPYGNVRARVLPKGFLRRIGIQGIYMPFSGEGFVDGSLHPIILPFTMAHEMAHGYGFTDEGICNFLAFLACEQSGDPFITYCGRYALFQYVRSDLRDFATGFYIDFIKTMDAGIQNDREAVILNADLYTSYFPGMASAMNDLYLKAQGIEEGTESYDHLVNLGLHWLREHGKIQFEE